MHKTNCRKRSIELFEMWKEMPDTPENKEARAEIFAAYREAFKYEVELAKCRLNRTKAKRKEKKQEKKAPVNAGLPPEWLKIKEN